MAKKWHNSNTFPFQSQVSKMGFEIYGEKPQKLMWKLIANTKTVFKTTFFFKNPQDPFCPNCFLLWFYWLIVFSSNCWFTHFYLKWLPLILLRIFEETYIWHLHWWYTQEFKTIKPSQQCAHNASPNIIRN